MTTVNRLNPSNVIDIRRAYNLGTSSAELAANYNVTQRTIQRIITGEIWSSIPSDKPLKGYHGKYEVTADGRVWSTAKKSYIATTNGIVRLTTKTGKKAKLEIANIVKTHFAV